MNSIAWSVVFGYVLVTFAVGFWFARRAHRGVDDYFLSGRTLPWYVLGTSMVVTTFAPDTPVGMAEYARSGAFNGWFGWNLVLGQILAVFLFARLWRRSGIRTDNELLEMRYSGRSAAGLRLFKALHFSILGNLFTLCVVIAALVKVLDAVISPADVAPLLGFTPDPDDLREWVRWGVTGFAVAYALLAGFWGVVATDFMQFVIAMIGTTAFAWIASNDLGGMEAVRASAEPVLTSFWPDDPDMTAKIWVYVLVMWWGSYNADGSGYLCQRMLAAKNERHASLGTLWFSVAYAGLRMWPWLVIGTLSLLVLPMIAIDDGGTQVLVNQRVASEVSGTVVIGSEGVEQTVQNLPIEVRDGVVVTEKGEPVSEVRGATAYPRMLTSILGGQEDLLHSIVLGLIVAAFLAAFMSTVDTLLNWGGSYLVNDVMKRFVWRDATEKQLLWFAKAAVLVIVTLAVLLSRHVSSVKDAWILVWGISAGLGPVLILRWFWWRVNAWSEISALATSLTLGLGFELMNRLWLGADYEFALAKTYIGIPGAAEPLLVLEKWEKILALVGSALVMAVVVTRFTRPADPDRLDDFVRKVRPPGAWSVVRKRVGDAGRPDLSMPRLLGRWVCGVATVYGITFAIGGAIYGHPTLAWSSLAVAALGSFVLLKLLHEFGDPDEEENPGARVVD